MKEEVLMDLGLSQNEAKVYVALLETGATKIGKIATVSKIHRTNVYDAMKKLVIRGLVSSVIKDGDSTYQATHPKNLMNIIKDKEIKLSNLIPQLELSHKMAQEKSQVSIYEGLRAAKDAMEHMLSLQQPIHVFGVSQNASLLAGPFLSNFHKRRIEQKVVFKHIYNADCSERAKFLNSMAHTEARYLPQKYDVPVATNICGDEVILILWEKDTIVIQIKNARIADSYKKYFDLLWSISKEFK